MLLSFEEVSVSKKVSGTAGPMLLSFEDIDITKKVTGTAGHKKGDRHHWSLQVVLLCLSRIVNQFPHLPQVNLAPSRKMRKKIDFLLSIFNAVKL
jgi:hypothetical protein